MEQSITIRKPSREDIAECAQIISTEHAWSVYGFDYKKSYDVLSVMEDIIYVAVKDGKLAGFITIRINGVGNIGSYVRMVAVKKEYRNLGIGEILIEYIQRIANENGKNNIFLICSADNSNAKKFYEKVGFRQVGILDNLVVKNHDEILFRRTVTE